MGFNSLVMINNDAISVIDNDPAGWWRGAKFSLDQFPLPQEFGFRGYSNYFRAVHNAHADSHAVYAVGGNYCSVLLKPTHMGNKGHHTEEQQVELVRKMADRLGYTLRPKVDSYIPPR